MVGEIVSTIPVDGCGGTVQGLPRVADKNTPRLMDAAGECLLYDEFRPNVHLVGYRFQILQRLSVLKLPAMIVTLSKYLNLKENPHEEV